MVIILIYVLQKTLSISVGTTAPSERRHHRRHMIAMSRRANLILVSMYVIASLYDSSFFSAILLASCFIMRVAEGPAPPPQMQENTSGTKLLFSTSIIRCSYFRHFNES